MRGLRVYGNIYRPMFGQVLQSAGCSIDLEILSLPSCATAFTSLPCSSGHCSKELRPTLASRALPDWGWAYFDRTGLVRVTDVAPFDNGASYFHSGLVWVFCDRKYGLTRDRGILATPLYDGINEFDKDQSIG
jgi:hypothetical protein